jgi:hypothetical protein
MNEHETILEQAMDAFVEVYAAGTLTDVATFLSAYPDEVHADMRAFIAEYLAMQVDIATLPVDEEALAAVDSARARMLEALRHPDMSLTKLRQAKDLLPDEVAEQINLPIDFVARLERGGIDLLSIPRRRMELLVTRLADVLGRSAQEITSALWMPPRAAAPLRLSADDSTVLPQEERMDFAEALERSVGLTSSMRAEWLMQQEHEGA